ncbi:MAG TPA: MarR family transcriptional regulator [Acidimicrobiales bacterium]|jgi:DNA-binding MarR family transcriptional regulator
MARLTTDRAAVPEHVEAQADQLLTVMASLRRSGRFLARQPVELSSLTSSQLDLMRTVLRRPGISVAEAADDLGLAPNTVSTLVRQLTGQRLLTRRVDPNDRRVARLALTPSMQRKVSEFRDRRIATLGAALSGLSAEERRNLESSIGVLERVAEGLRQQANDPSSVEESR